MSQVETTSAEAEGVFHDYVGNRIPWYIRLIWLFFWIFVIYYTIRYMFPAIQVELFERP